MFAVALTVVMKLVTDCRLPEMSEDVLHGIAEHDLSERFKI